MLNKCTSNIITLNLHSYVRVFLLSQCIWIFVRAMINKSDRYTYFFMAGEIHIFPTFYNTVKDNVEYNTHQII